MQTLDPALAGYCRAGHCRAGVYRPDWDNKVIAKLKSISAKSAGGIDPFITGSWRTGHVRTGVYVPLFDEALEKLKEAT